MSHGNKSSHEDNRKKVCAPCGRKIIFGVKKPEKFLITTKTEQLIKKFISENFDLKNEKYPVSICTTCKITLLDAEKNKFQRPFQEIPNYTDMMLPKETRKSQDTCNCFICLTGRFKGHTKIDKGKGHKKDLKIKIDASTGLYGASTMENLPVSPVENKNVTNLMCSKCFTEIGKGISHDCKNSKENLLKMLEKLPEKSQNQIVATIIKNKVEMVNPTAKKNTNVSFKVSAGGRETTVVLNPIIKENVSFDEESLDNFRTNLGVSGNQMRKITNFVRCNVGRKSIPTHYLEHLSKKSKVLDNVYKYGVYDFDCENDASKQKHPRPVVYADAEELLDAVIENRKLEGNYIVKVLADGGQGFFKISLTILPEDYSPTDVGDENNQSDSNESGGLTRKRKLYSQGGTISKKDFKLLLIVNGQQTASAMYPCPYCFITLDYLKKNPYCNALSVNTNASSTDNLEESENSMQLKTFGDLRADYDKFLLLGNNKKFSKECRSTVNLPLFNEADNICVLQKCVIPELHVLQGFVNHLFWHGLVPLLSKEKALLWPKKLKVISKNYHGDAFEGNACRKLLKEADKLNDQEIYGKVGYFKILPYINAYKAMNKVVDCCFISGKVGSSLDSHIDELSNSLRSIEKLSEPLKLHVILAHVKESLQYIENGFGLGFWSEQSGEAVHRNFLNTWNSYKMNNVHDESYASRLHKAVTEFSSLHL